MHLRLDSEESEVLSEMVMIAISELQSEIARTDHREFKAMLIDKLSALRSVQQRLDTRLAAAIDLHH